MYDKQNFAHFVEGLFSIPIIRSTNVFKQSFPAWKKILQVIWVNGLTKRRKRRKTKISIEKKVGMTEAHDLQSFARLEKIVEHICRSNNLI